MGADDTNGSVKPVADEAPEHRSVWVYTGPAGRLVYGTTPSGDRIMDFSQAGYMGGGVALPDVSVKRIVHASGGNDDGAAIQAAIDEVSVLPLEGCFRGAVLLAPGDFACPSTIRIATSGVVLRGSGSGIAEGTRSTIRLTGIPHPAIAAQGLSGDGNDGRTADPPPTSPVRTTIANDYVPSGATQFEVANATGFVVGDVIVIRRPATEAWIRFMKMHELARGGRPQTWMRAGSTTDTERRIAAISEKTIALDVPLSDSFDAKYLNPPGTIVAKIRPPDRVSQMGIECLHIESPPQAINHSQPHFSALRISGQDCWVRDVMIDETMNSVAVRGRCITLERVTINRRARHQGSSLPAEFAPNGSQVLLDRCVVNADNVWYAATGGGHPGPTVLLNCTFAGYSRAESHQRWSTGMLLDNCRVPEGGIALRNRGSSGSGHGWSMGWAVLWNCVAQEYFVEDPPGAINWMIGCVGARMASPHTNSGSDFAEGTEDSHGSPVAPRSLYLAQLAERLGVQALRNIR